MTDIVEELRVMAKDGGHLTLQDRQVIARAAEIVEEMTKTQAALIESQAMRIALNDRLLGLVNERNAKALAPISARCEWTMWSPLR